LILIFEELRSILFGDEVHGVAIPALLNYSIPLTDTLSYPVYRLFITAVCLAVAGLLYFVIHKTRIGMMIRAGTSNREMAASLGVNIPLLFALVFAVGMCLAAFAGAIAAPISSVFPGMGNQILIICFVVVVIGGIGSINGAMIASLAIGFADTVGKVIAAEYSAIAVYLVMALILLWRPQGIANKA
jgi:branched-chain amino acid transport system permease protein